MRNLSCFFFWNLFMDLARGGATWLERQSSHSTAPPSLRQSQHLHPHNPSFLPTLTHNTMVDNAPGQPDKSIQVKLVLLGTSSKNRPDCLLMFRTTHSLFTIPRRGRSWQIFRRITFRAHSAVWDIPISSTHMLQLSPRSRMSSSQTRSPQLVQLS